MPSISLEIFEQFKQGELRVEPRRMASKIHEVKNMPVTTEGHKDTHPTVVMPTKREEHKVIVKGDTYHG